MRESDSLLWQPEGKIDVEIAAILGISPATVAGDRTLLRH